MRFFLPLAVLLFAFSALSAPLREFQASNLAWSLPSGARIEGSTLFVEIKEGDSTNAVHCEAPLDLSGLLGDGLGLVMTIRLRAEGVTKPEHEWNGVKFMLRYEDADTGKTHFPGASAPIGTYGWRTVTNRVNILTSPVNPVDGRATLVLGLQESTGKVEFDLDSLTIATEDAGVRRVNEGWIVRYPGNKTSRTTATTETAQPNLLQGLSDLAGSPKLGGRRGAPLKGCMLPLRPTTEDDIATLASWGATLVRFQIGRNWSGVDDNQDLAEYASWVDSRLDNLEDVLKWCAARGMKVCVDLHAPPGGKRAGDRAMNMFFNERFADAFVETWRRIATRCAPIVQTMGPVIYGYDLINEPIQREPAPFSYWEVQRRAAEAIRAIDPDAPIIVESNLGCVAESYRYLSPLAMDNVIYQVHLYKPYEYTHQGVWDNPREKGGRPLVWPDQSRGWTTDHLRRVLEPVRKFQEKHHARIYVGEFSAVSWAPGAENYLRDCIALFAEYGWDWTYHAFREWGAWSVEHEAIEPGRASPSNFRPSSDNPRKQALLEGLRQQPTAIDSNRLQPAADCNRN